MNTPRIYLAGPDVFVPDPVAFGDVLKGICAEHGIEGIFPMDSDVTVALLDLPTAYAIARANEFLIQGADGVIANMTPFRGPSMDAGTIFEIGYARALGKPVFGYTTSKESFGIRTRTVLGLPGAERDSEGMLIEDFGCVDNLMIDGAIMNGNGFIHTHEDSMTAFTMCVKEVSETLRA